MSLESLTERQQQLQWRARLPQELSASSADVQVQHGRIKTVQLAEHITTGRQQWLQWHADFAENLPALIQVSEKSTPYVAAEGWVDRLRPSLQSSSVRISCSIDQ